MLLKRVVKSRKVLLKQGVKAGLIIFKRVDISQPYKEVLVQDADISSVEKVNSGAMEKICKQITALVDRCKGNSSWRAKLWLERMGRENKKFGDYQH